MKIPWPVGSEFTVRAMCCTNSGSVRVASNVGGDDLACDHIKARSQRGRPVSCVFELLLDGTIRLHRLVGSIAFKDVSDRTQSGRGAGN